MHSPTYPVEYVVSSLSNPFQRSLTSSTESSVFFKFLYVFKPMYSLIQYIIHIFTLTISMQLSTCLFIYWLRILKETESNFCIFHLLRWDVLNRISLNDKTKE